MGSPSLTVFRGFPPSKSYVWSPFVTKLETRLRFAGLKYQLDQGGPLKGPRGKIPYVSVSREGDTAAKVLSDTNLISEELVASGLAEDLNAKLNAVEKAQDLALRALLEDKLIFYQQYERWEQNFYTMRPKVLAALPWPVQIVVGQLAYRHNHSTLNGQGTGRFTAEEITRFKTEIWENVNALLMASKTKRGAGVMFFALGGEGPTEADTTLFGFVASGLVCQAGPESQKILRSYPTILDYANRIHERYFPDHDHWD